MPQVSVVIPAYNQPQMLSETLRSVQEQTMPPAEIIVIDDGSDEALENTTQRSTRLPMRFVRHERNMGPAVSVVDGVRESRSGLVTTLNHDDVWEPRFLERLGGQLDAHPEACFAFCDHGIMHADGDHDEGLSRAASTRYGRADLTEGLLRDVALYEAGLLRQAVAASSFAIVRVEALDLALIAAGGDMWDYFLTVGACKAGNTAFYVAERLGWYRVSSTMLTATWTDPRKQVEMARPHTAILLIILRSPQFKPIQGAVLKRLALAIRHALAGAIRTRSVGSIGRMASRIIRGALDAKRLAGGDVRGGQARA